MPFSPENVTLAGSQLVFHNTYAGTVTTAYHNAILTAEHAFESQFSDPVTISVSFDFANLGAGFLAQNQFNNTASVSYSALRTALINNATPGDADDQHAVALLQAQANDPTVGLPSATGNNLVTAHNYLIGGGMARLLGLGGAQGPNPDVQLVLGTGVTWDFDPSNGISSGAFDAVGAIEHEISEGGFGRVAGVGVQNHAWGPLDLFRYSSPGHRDVTGGKDGVSTFFSVDGNTMLTPFHNSVNTAGTFDGQDFGDWNIGGDSFGFGKPGTIGALSAVDLQVLDILGWTRIGSTPPTTDDFRDSLNDTTAPLGQLSFNGQGTATSTGNLEVAGDRDWFSVHLVGGTSYVINLTGQQGGGGTLQDPYLYVHDSGGGAPIAHDDDITPGVNVDSQLTFVAPTTGTYYIEAGAFNEQYAGTYRISVATAAPTDDYANSLADNSHPIGNVAINGSSTGALEIAGDRDWFAVQLIAGDSYVINLQGQQAGDGTLVDPYLRVHDNTGALLAENDDITTGVNRDSRLTFVATGTGTFYLEAGAFDDSYTGTYRVSINHVTPSDDYADSKNDTTAPFGQVAVNGSSTGTLETVGDRDWFAVQLVAGTTYTINLTGAQGGGGTLLDPYLRLHDSSGAEVAQNDDINLGVNVDSQLPYTALASGTYYIEAGAYADSYTGTYRINVSGTAPADDYPDNFNDSSSQFPFGLVAVNSSSSGNLEAAGDRDWFSVQMLTGQRYIINLTGVHGGGGSLLDPYLRLYNDAGTLQLQNDDIKLNVNPDSQIVATITNGGTFYIEAGAFNDLFAGTYTVSVADAVITGTAKKDTIDATHTAKGQLNPYSGADTIYGLGGDDVIAGLGGGDTIDGGAGNDTVSFASDTAGVTVSLLANTAAGGQAAGDTLVSIENLTGGSGDDWFEGTNGANVFIGGANTAAGDTVSYANAGGGVDVSLAITKAQATGGGGTDTLSGIENLVGSAFDDVLGANSSVNHLDGGGNGAGGDTVSYAASKIGVMVDLTVQNGVTAQTSTGDASGDVLQGFENVIGSGKSDILIGTNGDNVIEGGAGADVLHGNGGSDTVSYASSKSGVTVTLGANGELNSNGGFVNGGDAKGDTGDGFANIFGSAKTDFLTGNNGANTITGAGGADGLTGGGGADRFAYQTASQGNDIIVDFGNGADTLVISKTGFGGNLVSQGATPDTDYFVSAAGHTATEAGHGQLLFDTTLHQLFWDDDGAGAGTHAAVMVAWLINGHNLTANEINLV